MCLELDALIVQEMMEELSIPKELVEAPREAFHEERVSVPAGA